MSDAIIRQEYGFPFAITDLVQQAKELVGPVIAVKSSVQVAKVWDLNAHDSIDIAMYSNGKIYVFLVHGAAYKKLHRC